MHSIIVSSYENQQSEIAAPQDGNLISVENLNVVLLPENTSTENIEGNPGY